MINVSVEYVEYSNFEYIYVSIASIRNKRLLMTYFGTKEDTLTILWQQIHVI